MTIYKFLKKSASSEITSFQKAKRINIIKLNPRSIKLIPAPWKPILFTPSVYFQNSVFNLTTLLFLTKR